MLLPSGLTVSIMTVMVGSIVRAQNTSVTLVIFPTNVCVRENGTDRRREPGAPNLNFWEEQTNRPGYG